MRHINSYLSAAFLILRREIIVMFDSPKFKRLLKASSTAPGNQAPIIDLCSNPARQKERQHIEAILCRLPNRSFAHDIQDRLLSVDTGNYLGAWNELMVYDWLYGMNMRPVPQPPAPDGRSKLDFLVETDSLRIYIDVASVQEARKDKPLGRVYGSARVWWPEDAATFATMRERLIDKMGQHPTITEAAYVVCLCLESRAIDIDEVKTCFLGTESVDVATGMVHPDMNGEIFEIRNDSSCLAKYRSVSALLVAKHSGVSVEDGYRLVFGLIQNPYANIRVHDAEFGELRRYVIVSESEGGLRMAWRQ